VSEPRQNRRMQTTSNSPQLLLQSRGAFSSSVYSYRVIDRKLAGAKENVHRNSLEHETQTKSISRAGRLIGSLQGRGTPLLTSASPRPYRE
jgi:hypothetical protein